MFPKSFVGIKGVSLMGILKGLNKGGELTWGISSTLIDSREQLLEFSPDWVLLKLSLIVWIIFEFFEMLDSESELSVNHWKMVCHYKMFPLKENFQNFFEFLALKND